MALTKETIKVKVSYTEEYEFNGKDLDSSEIESIKSRIEDNIKQGVYDAIDGDMFERENFDMVQDTLEIDTKITSK